MTTPSDLFAPLLESLPRAIQVIENGLPRAEKQLAESEQRLADLTKQLEWETLPKREQNRQIREAKADIATDQKTLSQARSAHVKLEKKMQGV